MKKFILILLVAIVSTFTSFAKELDKDSLYTSLKNYDYKRIDSITYACPKSYRSFNTICKYIKKYAVNDQEKARAIFVWIVDNIDYKHGKQIGRNVGYYPDQNGDSTFKNRSGVCAGYSQLYLKFCTALNIECKYITGYTKDYGHTILLHAWNIIYLYNTPFIIEVTWADAREKGFSTRNEIDFFFLADPKGFIYTHFPCNNSFTYDAIKLYYGVGSDFFGIPGIYDYEYQLLEKPVSIQFFISTKPYTPTFARNNGSYPHENIKGIYSYKSEDKLLFYKINIPNYKEVVNQYFGLGYYNSDYYNGYTKVANIPHNKIFLNIKNKS